MSKNFQIFTQALFAFIIITVGHYVIAAQTISGDWKAEAKTEKTDKTDKIYLSFERRTDKGGRNQNGSSYDYAELQNLSREQALNGGAVKFSLVREAGTIDCTGSFANGKGAGTFRFTANPQFVSAMKTRGFDFEKPSKFDDGETVNKLFAAATINVTTALADDLISANFGNLDVDDLFKAAIFKVNSQFMNEMKASGFANLTMEDLVKARIFKIDADFVRQVAQNGFDKEPFESLVKMQIFKITPEFITEMRGEGFANLRVEDLVKMKIFKIDSAFIKQAQADGVPLDVEKLVQKRIGVWGR